jgi:hypothetical protein
VAVLLDFGLTKLYDPDVSTQTLGRAVTEGFSPLEQYIGKTSPQSDIYSMGATFYILWTNRLPPAATSRGARDELIAPRLLNPALSPKLEWILLKALSLHADQRFQSMGEFAQSLREPSFNSYDEPTVAVPFNPARANNPLAGASNPSVPIVLPGYTGNAYPPTPSPSPSYPVLAPARDNYSATSAPGYNQAPYLPISPQQSYGPGSYGQSQMNYPGNGPQAPPLTGYPFVPPGGVSATPVGPAQQQKRRRPLPVPSEQGCLWGVIQGLLAAGLVLFVKEQAVFYLATVLGILFYVLAGFITTRRGGNVARGGWSGYWTGIWGTIVFWVGLAIGLLVSTLQRYQMLSRSGSSADPRSLFPRAWQAVQPQWPTIPQIAAAQSPFVNFLILMLVGLAVAWIAGWVGGLCGRARYASKNPIGP